MFAVNIHMNTFEVFSIVNTNVKNGHVISNYVTNHCLINYCDK